MGALTIAGIAEDQVGLGGLRMFGVRTWASAGLLTALVFGYFLIRLGVTSEAIRVNNCILGADVGDYFRGLSSGHWGVFRIRKHALAVASIAAIGWPLTQMGVSAATAAIIALAAFVAIGSLAFFLYLRLLGLGCGATFFMVLAAIFAFGSLTIFSVVETYGFTFSAMAVAMLAFIVIARHSKNHPVLCSISAGIAGAIPGTANLPALACVLLYAGLAKASASDNPWQRFILVLALPVAIATALSSVPMLYTDLAAAFAWQRHYLDSLASIANFVSPDVLADYLSSFWVFALVSPLDMVQYRYTSQATVALGSSGLRLAGYIVVMFALSFGAFSALRDRRRRSITLWTLMAVGSLFIFYLYFNPAEAMLYSSQWILLLFAAAAPGYVGRRFSGPLFAACFVILAIINYPPLMDPRSTDPSAYCGPSRSAEPASPSRPRATFVR
ncbi:hypothetical protein PYH37_004070 [Sinorhizobium numidicum]|uniref:DUF2029 domain-containing protein n=1 Tax=Sinorhizobium numidicum TaxID=680248 RepID=A0ABY8CX69_9HYPH|nr:hypothetical protein [Sinorhizobium numidicum]WEX75825.1 hypothetical protein PYH37_004070 [Sinorhizobium numidicum]WEX82482.1 hypothetical protein PYH38_004782 [Sinorhizobium numidicum]